jgi:hypothetical protein
LAAATPLARNGGLWTIAEDLPVKLDTLDTRPYWDFTGREFGVALELELDQHVILNDDPFEAVVELESPAVGTNMAVIMEILLGDSTLFYRGGDLRHHGASGATTLVVAGARSLAPRGATGVRLHTYIYNPDGAAIKVYGLRLFRRDANPVQNAAFMPIGRLGRRAE